MASRFLLHAEICQPASKIIICYRRPAEDFDGFFQQRHSCLTLALLHEGAAEIAQFFVKVRLFRRELNRGFKLANGFFVLVRFRVDLRAQAVHAPGVWVQRVHLRVTILGNKKLSAAAVVQDVDVLGGEVGSSI